MIYKKKKKKIYNIIYTPKEIITHEELYKNHAINYYYTNHTHINYTHNKTNIHTYHSLIHHKNRHNHISTPHIHTHTPTHSQPHTPSDSYTAQQQTPASAHTSTKCRCNTAPLKAVRMYSTLSCKIHHIHIIKSFQTQHIFFHTFIHQHRKLRLHQPPLTSFATAF